MKTLGSVILALIMLALEVALAAIVVVLPVKALRARGGGSPAAAIRHGSQSARDRIRG